MQGHPRQRAVADWGVRLYGWFQAVVLVAGCCMLGLAGVSADSDPAAAWTPSRRVLPQSTARPPSKMVTRAPEGTGRDRRVVVDARDLPARRPNHLLGRQASWRPAASWSPKPAGHSAPGLKRVALTFDDGPDGRVTPVILDILRQKQVPATFYLVGTHAQRYPEVVRRIAREGHEIGNHSWSHRDMRKLGTRETLQEIQRLNQWIEHVIGYRPATIRPPYGVVTKDLLQTARQLGQPLVGWTVDPRDWAGTAPREMDRIVRTQLRPGGIVLLHSFGGRRHLENTVRFLPHLIDELRTQGYSFVRVSELKS